MMPTYYIELHPTELIYFNGFHHGTICVTKNIKEAQMFNTYTDAQKELAYIISNNTDSNFYTSIIELYLSLNKTLN